LEFAGIVRDAVAATEDFDVPDGFVGNDDGRP